MVNDHFCTCAQRFADWRWAGFSVQKLIRRTELSATTKLSSGDETPPIANVLLCVVFLLIVFVMSRLPNCQGRQPLYKFHKVVCPCLY